MLPAFVVAFADSFNETSFLVVGSFLLLSLLLVQVIWAYRNGTSSSGQRPQPISDDASDPEPKPDSRAGADADVQTDGTAQIHDDMVICPECSQPTEAEYRYCRHCAEDTGKSYVGSGGDDGSSRSGML